MMPRKVFLLGEYDSEDRYVSPPFMEWLKNDREVVETRAWLVWGLGGGSPFFVWSAPFTCGPPTVVYFQVGIVYRLRQ